MWIPEMSRPRGKDLPKRENDEDAAKPQPTGSPGEKKKKPGTMEGPSSSAPQAGNKGQGTEQLRG